MHEANAMFDTIIILQLFALLNPLSSFPVLMAAYKKKMDVQKIAISASVTAYLVALVVIFVGPQLFGFYGIGINSFRVAGGIMLLLLGIETVRPKPAREEVNETDSFVAIIATPLLTGPSVISFMMIQALETGTFPLLIDSTVAFVVVGVTFFLFALMIPWANAKVIEITSKVLGLFTTAIAIEMLAKGISGMVLVMSKAS